MWGALDSDNWIHRLFRGGKGGGVPSLQREEGWVCGVGGMDGWIEGGGGGLLDSQEGRLMARREKRCGFYLHLCCNKFSALQRWPCQKLA